MGNGLKQYPWKPIGWQIEPVPGYLIRCLTNVLLLKTNPYRVENPVHNMMVGNPDIVLFSPGRAEFE